MAKNTGNEAFRIARDRYGVLGVDVDEVLRILEGVRLSLHCWQGDDVAGFEHTGAGMSGGGIQVTGNYPGKARNADELREDLEKVYGLLPGRHRLNLHAMYGEFSGKPADRDEIEAEHFQGWIGWADSHSTALDFNATCFSHPRADSGFTLGSKESSTRAFWIEHVRRCREIGAAMGCAQGSPCIHNLWIPDGSKDSPADRWTHRRLLRESLDTIYADVHDAAHLKDSLESKLFGIGSESYVVGSHEFYMGYALTRGLMLCLDLGHFHPTESVSDKVSAVLQFSDEILLHVSRGVRWDSDHVVVLNDDLMSLMQEIVRGEALERVHIALDFFDATFNRVGAWVLGSRATLKALMIALLEPRRRLRELEEDGNILGRLALMEELKSLPWGAVWDGYCERMDVPPDSGIVREIERYEKEVTGKRT